MFTVTHTCFLIYYLLTYHFDFCFLRDTCIIWVQNMDELKQRLLHVWHGMDQSITDNAIDEWRWRLQACARANDGHLSNCCDSINIHSAI